MYKHYQIYMYLNYVLVDTCNLYTIFIFIFIYIIYFYIRIKLYNPKLFFTVKKSY
jgi:hypothetical protein